VVGIERGKIGMKAVMGFEDEMSLGKWLRETKDDNSPETDGLKEFADSNGVLLNMLCGYDNDIGNSSRGR